MIYDHPWEFFFKKTRIQDHEYKIIKSSINPHESGLIFKLMTIPMLSIFWY